MTARGNYKTKHYDQIHSFMKESARGHLTVPEIQVQMAEAGIVISTATLYRNLERMVAEGLVMKYSLSPDSPAYFEYVEKGCVRELCYHGKCDVCGKIIHMHSDEVETIETHMAMSHHFHIDWRRTIFYGICDDCLKEKAEKRKSGKMMITAHTTGKDKS